MPDKKRKKRKALTNAEILKLIKKLKPKTQQIVRVNIGDKGTKSSASGGAAPIRPYAQQDAVVFTSAYSAPTPSLPPPPPPQRVPSAPLPPEPVKAAATFEAPKRVQPLPPQRLIQGDPFKPSKLAEKIKSQFGKYLPTAREREQEFEEYTYTKRPSFAPPPQNKQSDLGTKTLYAYFSSPPKVNDPYQDDGITITESQDQIGLQPNAVSSDQWVITPEGNEAPFQAAAVAAAFDPEVEAQTEQPYFSLADAMQEQADRRAAAAAAAKQQQEEEKQALSRRIEEEVLSNYQQQLANEEQLRLYKQELKGEQPQEALPKVRRTKKPYVLVEDPEPTKADKIIQINDAISKGTFNLDRFKTSNEITLRDTFQSGVNKGKIRSTLSDAQVGSIYKELRTVR